jgi:dTDP-4-amino-4,6-dideoxygalactose transaminase
MSQRILLSPPHLSGREAANVLEALESNWVAPLGPHVDAFEREMAAELGVREAVAVCSGTAAIHLGLGLLGVRPGDEVWCSTLTFAASANPILYLGAEAVFVDSMEGGWGMDPDLLEEALEERGRCGRLPRAVVVVDLYGDCADYDRILPVCARWGVPVLEDAAEALGAEIRGRRAGGFGAMGVLSFNGNKMLTTSGGGMLMCGSDGEAARARYLAAQARVPAPHYEHVEVGYNYRMSNLLAAVGRAQLSVLWDRVAARRRVRGWYERGLSGVDGLRFFQSLAGHQSSCWMTCVLVDPEICGVTREEVRLALEEADIESRPCWKPLHLQKSFAGCRVVGGRRAEACFERGLCLPSGSGLGEADAERVCGVVRGVVEGGRKWR